MQYELGKSNQSATYLTDTSVKQYSQDFQTVFLYDDLYGHNEVTSTIFKTNDGINNKVDDI